ncbi:hypothetical protein NEILACOT_04499 [Neisseria lactamica ATCC 23970]|uniref:Uncharacterized protein n=1 Tax=Neisseria lactamica ATCC 23970 TaxID=546265 RepID=D0WAD0_NEILA|nr:hypothetical protein NEILACOT_04499 [Neisseria lactamica ATCC 23970]
MPYSCPCMNRNNGGLYFLFRIDHPIGNRIRPYPVKRNVYLTTKFSFN